MKSKILFIIGIVMLAFLMIFILFDLFGGNLNYFLKTPLLWQYEVTWVMFYLYSALIDVSFISYTVLKARDFFKNINGSRFGSLAKSVGGVAITLFSVGVCGAWHFIYRHWFHNPFNMSNATMQAIFKNYILISCIVISIAILMNLIALTLKIVAIARKKAK